MFIFLFNWMSDRNDDNFHWVLMVDLSNHWFFREDDSGEFTRQKGESEGGIGATVRTVGCFKTWQIETILQFKNSQYLICQFAIEI